jgi:hypothetical protein
MNGIFRDKKTHRRSESLKLPNVLKETQKTQTPTKEYIRTFPQNETAWESGII